jgi:hypothetical protein
MNASRKPVPKLGNAVTPALATEGGTPWIDLMDSVSPYAGKSGSREMEGQHAFEMVDGIACLRIAGSYRFEAAIAQVTSALAQAFMQRQDRLLVVATDVVGFDSPDIPARHQMIRHWASAAQAWVRLAIVVRAELIDPEKFAVIAGRNFGFVSDVFESEHEALDWLRTLEPIAGR